MTVANTQGLIKINSNDISRRIKEIQQAFEVVDEDIGSRYRKPAVRKAVRPAFKRFKSLIPISVTGNLSQSAAMVVRDYKSNKVSVALAGYTMFGSNEEGARGWAQGFIEFGTGDRYTRGGNIASSYNAQSRGEFSSTWLKGGGGAILQNPPYPFAFFKKAKRGELVNLGRMPKGGSRGVAPLETAWNTTKGEVRTILLEEMKKAANKAIDAQMKRLRR